MANKLGEAAGGGRSQKSSVTKAHRFAPDRARAPALQLVVYELLSLLEEVVKTSEVRERLRALRLRIPILANETDIAQDLAEEDGDALED